MMYLPSDGKKTEDIKATKDEIGGQSFNHHYKTHPIVDDTILHACMLYHELFYYVNYPCL